MPKCKTTLEPSAWVVRFAPLVADGAAVLDVACGGGRHARHFLARGHPVCAIDRDISDVQDLAGASGFEPIEADLEDGAPWPLEGRQFGAVVVTNYLHRPLFAHLIAALAPGGVLIYETFARGNEAFRRPKRREHLLEAGELLEAVRGTLQVVAYEHGLVERPRPSVRQRLCAVRQSEPVALPAGD